MSFFPVMMKMMLSARTSKSWEWLPWLCTWRIGGPERQTLPKGGKGVGPRINHNVVCIEVSVGESYHPWFLDTVSSDGFMRSVDAVSGSTFKMVLTSYFQNHFHQSNHYSRRAIPLSSGSSDQGSVGCCFFPKKNKARHLCRILMRFHSDFGFGIAVNRDEMLALRNLI